MYLVLKMVLYRHKEITMLFDILQNNPEQVFDYNSYVAAIETLYNIQKKSGKEFPVNTLVKEYLSFIDKYKLAKKHLPKYTEYELLITKKGLYSDLEKLQSKSFVQLKNKLTPVKFEKDCFYFADNKILKSTHNYYYILDSAEKLYVYDPLINGIKYLSHSGLLNDNWPILAGNISFDKGKICYVDEESGHFKPRNRLFLLEDIFGENIYTDNCTLKHCHFPELQAEERCQMKSVQNLFDLYKYFFYNKI